MSDLVEQLRRYGEAVEEEALRSESRKAVLVGSWWRRQPAVLVAAAAVILVLALGGITMRLVRTAEPVKVVATDPRTPSGVESMSPATTSATADSTTTTSAPVTAQDPAPVPPPTTSTSLVRPSSIVVPPLPTTLPSPSPANTSPSLSPATTSPSSVTTTTPATPPVRGTATWTGGRDPRGTLQVGACPVGQNAAGCPGWRWAEVAPDGSFELLLSSGGASRDWKVVAFVATADPLCVFNCEWRNVQVGPSVTVSDAAPPETLVVAVAARVVDVFVRDRNNRPFEGGGVMVKDSRCPELPCPYELSPMYRKASSTDGAARIVVDSSLSYELTGMAANTGWSNPQHTSSDGTKWWFSPTLRAKGSAIPEGHTFLIEGAPA